MDGLLCKVGALRDAPYHEACIRFRIYSWRKRKDGEGLRKALVVHKDIDVKKIYFDRGSVASIYIDIMDGCFEFGVSDEGFCLMRQVNCLPLGEA